jgi:hypothetical protein
MRRSGLPQVGRALRFAVVIALSVVAVSSSACKSRDEPITEASAPVSTGTVQATVPIDPSLVAVPSVPTSTTQTTPTATEVPVAPANPNAAPETFAEATAPDPTKAGAWWPKRVGTFAAGFTGPTWYPKYLPPGYKFESLDIVEFDAGKSGLACDIIFLKGDKVLQFTQGSPKSRDYEIVSAGKAPWGTQTANIVHQDPADKSTPVMVVLKKDGNLAELSGDVSTEVLKKVAASMVVVK